VGFATAWRLGGGGSSEESRLEGMKGGIQQDNKIKSNERRVYKKSHLRKLEKGAEVWR
jgi:hypothetical protein